MSACSDEANDRPSQSRRLLVIGPCTAIFIRWDETIAYDNTHTVEQLRNRGSADANDRRRAKANCIRIAYTYQRWIVVYSQLEKECIAGVFL